MKDDNDAIREYDNKRILDALDGLEDLKKDTGTIRKDNSTKKIIGAILVILLIVGIFNYYNENLDIDINSFFSNKKDANDFSYDRYDDNVFLSNEYIYYNDTEDINEIKKQTDNIIVEKEYLNANKQLILKIKNNNQKYISDFEVYLIFYDNENKIIAIDSDHVDSMPANNTYFLKYLKTPESYTRYELYINKEDYGLYEPQDIREKINYEYKKVNNEIVIKAQNNSEEDYATLEFSVIYYDDKNNILDIEKVSGYFDEYQKEIICVADGITDNKTEKNIDYSKYEVSLEYAY